MRYAGRCEAMKASWKPQAKKPATSSRKPRWAKASRSAAERLWRAAWAAGRSWSGTAQGSSTAQAMPSATSAPAQPSPSISPCEAGTSTNCPSPPMAPVTPSAQLRRSAGIRRLMAPYTTPKAVPDSATPTTSPADRVKAAGLSAWDIASRPAA